MVKDSMNEGLPSNGQSHGNAALYISLAVALVIVGVGAFLGGIQYQKSTSGTSTTTAQGGADGSNRSSGGFGGARRSGGFGTVTAVSSTSITISETRPGDDSSSSGMTKTYTITSSTIVTNAGSTASASDIQTGDRVIVRTSASDTSTATSIMVNPSFGGGAGGQTQSDTNTSDSTDNSSST